MKNKRKEKNIKAYEAETLNVNYHNLGEIQKIRTKERLSKKERKTSKHYVFDPQQLKDFLGSNLGH